MSKLSLEDFRTSSSSIDEFLAPALKPRTAAGGKIRVSNLRQIEGAGFRFVSSDKLIRTSQKDFWRLGEDEDGPFIERLVTDDDGPVRE